MWKLFVFGCLFSVYTAYSILVYTNGTDTPVSITRQEQAMIKKGKQLFQEYNCIACHQLYGLGGYLGPELTTAYSDPARGELFMKVFLQAGGPRMPNFRFNEEEINSILSYLRYIDATAVTYKKR